ncbi:hypothetical protein [Bacteroides stercorirosoris]|uniref:hypothetical protein n=1 Tax=Bacteroides stercorirosoris TaxID=871324 RepID=UPI0023EFBF1C|nr:hypothetical protein [Bacteroides stercorirosoris]
MESKFKVGDRVRILDCPVMPDIVGKSGVIRHRQGDLYRVEVDGKVIPDYALEVDIELIPANPFGESNELISKLLKENNLEIMHLEMYLDTQNVVCVERTTYDAMCYKDIALKAFLECEGYDDFERAIK